MRCAGCEVSSEPPTREVLRRAVVLCAATCIYHEAVISQQVARGKKKDAGASDFSAAHRVLRLNFAGTARVIEAAGVCVTKAVAASVLVFTLAVSAPAFASSMHFTGDGKSAAVTIQSPTLGVLTTHAGELDWSWVGVPPAGQPASFYTYCVDPNHYLLDVQDVTLSSSDFLTSPGVTDAGEKAAWLVNTYAPSIHQSGSGADAAALQVAIWEAISDNNPNLSGGSFRLIGSPDIAAEAQGYLNALFSGPGGYHTSSALWLDATSGQDQMTPAPEPASLLLCGSGLILFARRIRSKGADQNR